MKHQQGTWQATRVFRKAASANIVEELALPTTHKASTRILLGRHEWVAFHGLFIAAIIAKVDSGARTSTLHAENIHLADDGQTVHFDTRSRENQLINCTASVSHHKNIKNSTGLSRTRVVIKTIVTFAGGLQFPIELTLANRSKMKCPVLIGRRAMSGYFMIDPQSDYLLGDLTYFSPS
jgi:ribosomal protein S6--L-glutamate ligase